MGTQTLTSPWGLADLGRRLVLLAAVSYAVTIIMGHLVIARGESVPLTLFWRLDSGPIHTGSYVTFEATHPIIGLHPARLTKLVVCDEGDQLAFHDDAFWCNGTRLGGYISRTWDDQPLEPFRFTGVIPAGQAFVMGVHPRSFDSRYFGWVAKSKLTRLVGLL
jgi:type IV secretory pathway protease TraF